MHCLARCCRLYPHSFSLHPWGRYLATTQLRTLDGELVTIANGSFTTAINLTHQWSQINLGIGVDYATDLDQAMTVIESVAKTMRRDPKWEK